MAVLSPRWRRSAKPAADKVETTVRPASGTAIQVMRQRAQDNENRYHVPAMAWGEHARAVSRQAGLKPGRRGRR